METRRQAGLPLLGGALVALFFLPFFSQFNSGLQDESLIALAASRVLDGERPYLDFSFHPNPGTYLTLSVLYRLFGQDVFSNRIMVVVLAFGFGWALTRLAIYFQSDKWALVPAALFAATGVTHYGVVGHHWYSHLSYLLGVVALSLWWNQPDGKRATLIGLALAVAWWMLQSGGAALMLLAVLVCLSNSRAPRLRHFAIALTTALLVSALLWLPFMAKESWSVYWQMSVVEVLFDHNPYNGSPYSWQPLVNIWSGIRQPLSQFEFTGPWIAWLTQSIGFLLVMLYKHGAFYPVLLVSALFIFFGPPEARKPENRLLWAAWLIDILVNFSRQDQLYINYLTPWLYLWTFLLLRNYRAGRALMTGLLLVFGLNYGFDAKQALFDSPYQIVTRRGTFQTPDRQLAATWNARFQMVESFNPAGSEAVSVFYNPALLFYGALRTPVKRFWLLPVFFQGEDLQTMKREMEADPPPFLYHLPVGPDVLSAYPMVNKEEFLSSYPRWVRVITQGYQPKKSIAGLEVWERLPTTGVEQDD